MKSIAIIPARGGSKRLPRKNMLPFMGKPMFLWTYEAAIQSNCFDEVVLSTEDEEFIRIAQEYDVKIHLRPQALAIDASGCVDVCLHILDEYSRKNIHFDALCCLYATAPLRTAYDIQQTMALLSGVKAADFAFATCKYTHSPYQALAENIDGTLSPAFPLVATMKSQALPETCIGNGSTYAAKVSVFQKYRSFYGTNLRGYLMPRMRSVDIDTQEDFETALCFAKYLAKEK